MCFQIIVTHVGLHKDLTHFRCAARAPDILGGFLLHSQRECILDLSTS